MALTAAAIEARLLTSANDAEKGARFLDTVSEEEAFAPSRGRMRAAAGAKRVEAALLRRRARDLFHPEPTPIFDALAAPYWEGEVEAEEEFPARAEVRGLVTTLRQRDRAFPLNNPIRATPWSVLEAWAAHDPIPEAPAC